MLHIQLLPIPVGTSLGTLTLPLLTGMIQETGRKQILITPFIYGITPQANIKPGTEQPEI
ncbi:MAG TPA: hypothetical protein DCX27_05525 [Balneola sp.]|nr:hypothetical protein [Balneola sp.]